MQHDIPDADLADAPAIRAPKGSAAMSLAAGLPGQVLDWVALIERLGEPDRDDLLQHFLQLDAQDRRLRFGTAARDDHLRRYVGGLDFDRAYVYGVRDADSGWLGIGHLQDETPDGAELGLSVLPHARRRGLGAAIFRYAVAQASRNGSKRLFMHMLSSNRAILSIARDAGMTIQSGSGEADAFLIVPDHATLIRQLVGDPDTPMPA
jgi:GNAT superfamily N-acetyltransferase